MSAALPAAKTKTMVNQGQNKGQVTSHNRPMTVIGQCSKFKGKRSNRPADEIRGGADQEEQEEAERRAGGWVSYGWVLGMVCRRD